MVLPDWLGRGTPPYGTIVGPEGEDEEMAAERAWLSSNVRCFLENALLQGHGAAKPETYRVATYWWCVMIDHAFRQKTGYGMEQFSSPRTAAACIEILGDSASASYAEDARRKFKSERWDFQWCGAFAVHIFFRVVL